MMRHCKRDIGLVALGLALLSGGALADTPAQIATSMLARAQSLDSKCNYLTPGNRTHLAHLVERAEAALTAKENANAATHALQLGRKQGGAASCNANEKENLNNVLSAAQAAATATGAKTPAKIAKPEPAQEVKVKKKIPPPVVERQKPVMEAVAKSPPAAKAKNAKRLLRNPVEQPARDQGLQDYAAMTYDYYLARRCDPQAGAALEDLYRQIVFKHDQVMRNHSRSQVAATLNQSARAARSHSCN